MAYQCSQQVALHVTVMGDESGETQPASKTATATPNGLTEGLATWEEGESALRARSCELSSIRVDGQGVSFHGGKGSRSHRCCMVLCSLPVAAVASSVARRGQKAVRTRERQASGKPAATAQPNLGAGQNKHGCGGCGGNLASRLSAHARSLGAACAAGAAARSRQSRVSGGRPARHPERRGKM